MVCYSPVRAYWSKRPHPSTGGPYLVFSPSQGKTTDYLTVPCGKCPGCLLDRSFAWSIRCTLESMYHRENYFLTLTYDKEHLPEDRLLNRVHVQQFVKRLRKHFSGYKIRVFYCGEYGEQRRRPHYHMIVFGLPLAEKGYKLVPVNYSKKGNVNYGNSKISCLWGHGLCTIGSFSSSSASYVAQYTLKKNKEMVRYRSDSLLSEIQTRLHNKKHIRRFFGEPFIGMSNRPAIAQQFFDQYYKDIFRRSSFNVTIGSENKTIRPLRFFIRKLKQQDPVMYHTFITRPSRVASFDASVLRSKIGHSDHPKVLSYITFLDKKSRNRYIKEQRTLRKLEARSDL